MLNSIQNAKRYLQWINETIRLDALSNASAKRQVYRGQVYWCFFGINIGSEQSEKRPCVVIQGNRGNTKSPNTIVAPITNSKSSLPTVVPIAEKRDAFGNVVLSGNVLLGNIVTVSKVRLGAHIADLTKHEMRLVNNAIAKSVDISTQYENEIARRDVHIKNLMESLDEKDKAISELKNLLES